MLEETLESPLVYKEINPEGNQPETNHQETNTVSSCSREVPKSPAHRNQEESWVPGAGEGERGAGV